jgi:hypothetical protein
MTAKDLMIDFINLVFTIIIIGLAIIYFIAGDNFENFKKILESLAPLGLLMILFLINLKFWQEKAKKKQREGNMEIILRLNFFDKLKSDFIVFSMPTIILLIAFFARGQVDLFDLIEALIVFVLAYLGQKWLFSKEKL